MTGEKGGYGLVYSEIMRSKLFSPEAKAIYAYLCTFAGAGETCYPSVVLMCDELQMSTDRFYRHIRMLLSAEVVKKAQERNGNRWGRTIYTISHSISCVCPQFEQTQIEDEDAEIAVSQNGKQRNQHPQKTGTNSTSFNNTSLNSTSTDNTSAVRICEAMNAAKKAAHHKGRLRIGGSYTLQALVDAGVEWQTIEDLTAEYLQQNRRMIDWYTLRQYCAKKMGIRL